MLIRENVPEARKLSPKIKARWLLERLVGLVPLLAASAVLIYLLNVQQVQVDPAYYALLALAIGAMALAAYGEVELRYRKFVYALREKDFLIQKGVIEKIRYVIPYEKIQNVTVSRDFIDIALGLGTLHIETAAHVYVENDIVLPGISNEENLVNELVQRSKLAKQDGNGSDEYYPEAMVAMMKQAVEELREIKAALRKTPQAERAPQPLTHKEAETAPVAEQFKGTKVLYEKTARKKKEA
ncbi:MAG TPA: PH domain-containing protein [Candidatus Bilamarchaeum sp.]|nr:PH domain-containing protein [Candidatus Bilamarchaeum sp.]